MAYHLLPEITLDFLISAGSAFSRHARFLGCQSRLLTYFISREPGEEKRPVILRNQSLERHAVWCTVDYEESIFQAFIVHKGRGKFLVLKDNQGGRYSNIIIDASNILSCEVEK